MKPIQPSVAEQVAQYAVNQGIEQVFMVTGGGAMFLNHAFSSHPRLRCTYMHHEQACAMAAEAYARIAGKPAIVNVTSGPGGINALNGVFGAFTDSIPMVVVSGQVKRETHLQCNPVPGLRQLGDQEGPITDMVRPITKGVWTVRDVNELSVCLPRAFELAISGRPGPVWIDMPVDVQGLRSPLPPINSESKSVQEPSNFQHCVKEVLDLLRKAHRPLILAGTGVRIAGACSELLELVERAGIPLSTAWTHDLIPSDHPLFAGRPGTIGTRAGNICLQSADLVLVIGSRLNIRQVSYNWRTFAANARVVQVDIDETELRKPMVTPDLAIVADARQFIIALRDSISEAEARLPCFAPWARWCRHIQDRYPALEPSCVSEGRINPYRAVARIFDHLPDNAIVACGNASACIMPFQVGKLRAGQRMFSNSGSASMGYELPAAIGAAIAAPERPVVCIAGDGSLQMNVQELQTLATLGLNVAIVVLANDGYLSIRQTQENFFGQVAGADRSSGVRCPDYVAVAKAYGIRAIDIPDVEHLESIDRHLSSSGPLLMQVQVDPQQGFVPKLKSRLDAAGNFLTPDLDDLFPFLGRDELAAVRQSAMEVRSIHKDATP